jgi:hypothetical protein
MQILAAIAVIILLFIAYNYMNKNHISNIENHKKQTNFSIHSNTNSQKSNKKTRSKGKILDFMEYKKKHNNINNKD